MKASEIINTYQSEIKEIAARYGIENISIFGSISRTEDTVDSDIDLLIDSSKPHSILKRGGLKYELEELLDRKVDVIYSSNPNLDQTIFNNLKTL